ncbi:MAG TPA: pteridine reductase [Candidatus Thiothrix moscowensis]|mgnify:CR=1 FL=1|uniref:pteridine reductase n=1 Tax=unclassified Thiothrix TaxID=2636184 RepID=UPI0025EAFD73|nr:MULTISPECIES: pteridine reductase [unclassified Thiothrix]HRJ51146.1 pteridine reductase [Candidatus Thiothrix moscowensis]HRJ91799.1 pteridine reductase [Candidatus Thiothrix moscowensis]
MATLEGKVALLTGAARRIGAETARILHAAGATVVIHYRNSSQDAEALQTELNTIRADSCFLVRGDLLDVASIPGIIQQTLAQTGRLDILVNNASSFYPTPLDTLSEQQFDDLIGTNLKAPLFMAQAAATHLRSSHGCIINIVDIHGFRPLKNYTAYCVAKAGLLMLTQSLARELGPQVRVNGVAPGAILWPEMSENHAMHADILAKTALHREGNPADIAKAVLFLARDADYITGQVIPVDGGRLLNH